MVDILDRSVLAASVGKDGTLRRDPALVTAYAAAKANRNIMDLPIGERFLERIDVIRDWAVRYAPHIGFDVVTSSQTYIDEHTVTEEPEFAELKRRHKTWDGIYLKKDKLSDIDLNPRWALLDDKPALSLDNIVGLTVSDPYRHSSVANIVDLRSDIRVDLYPSKGEPVLMRIEVSK